MFVLTCLVIAEVQAETCSTHLNAQFDSKYTCVLFDRISVFYIGIIICNLRSDLCFCKVSLQKSNVYCFNVL
jgi:hypothetical protein